MKKMILAVIFSLLNAGSFAFSESVRQSVWVNEAIVAAYQFDARNVMEKQQQLSSYFSPSGWESYSKALVESNLLESIKKNNYSVSSVALKPPKIKQLVKNHWQAKMPLLVMYENPQFSKKQILMVTITFQPADKTRAGQLYMIGSMQTEKIDDPCPCSKPSQQKSLKQDEQSAKGQSKQLQE